MTLAIYRQDDGGTVIYVRPMRISEIFYSIQGEGILAGVPSVFIRTTGCNLRCTWCDTPYTSWKPEGYQMMYGAMLTEVRRHWCGHVVITGGEPMILPDLVELTEKIKEIDQHITIARALDLPPKQAPPRSAFDVGRNSLQRCRSKMRVTGGSEVDLLMR